MNDKIELKPTTPVTFRDAHHLRRTIKAGKDTLRVEHGTITVTDTKHIDVLRKTFGLEEVNNA